MTENLDFMGKIWLTVLKTSIIIILFEEDEKMKCPYCGEADSKVIDSRPAEDGSSIRRRRQCNACQKRFTTYEKVETIPSIVIKKIITVSPMTGGRLNPGFCVPAINGRFRRIRFRNWWMRLKQRFLIGKNGRFLPGRLVKLS